MKQLKAIISTTHVDRQGHRMTLGALEGMMRQIQKEYVPTSLEHDIRVPTLGRIASAKIVQLEDGEYGLEAVTEMFETGDSPASLSGDGRRMKIHTENIQSISVEYDRGLSNDEGRSLLEELSGIAAADQQPKEYLKKSLEPVATLTIAAGGFAIGAIATGFFSRVGEDLYERLKTSLAKYYGTAKKAPEQVLDFRFLVKSGEQLLEVHVVLTNPTKEAIDELLGARFPGLDNIVVALSKSGSDLARLVIEYEKGTLRLRYAVRADCVPVVLPEEN